MDGKPRIERRIDMTRLVRSFENILANRVSKEIENLAKKYVAHPSPQHPYSQGPLRDSIHAFQIGLGGTPYVFTDMPYSLAQERGRPDLPQYTYTPYLGPAARDTVDKIQSLVAAAFQAAAILGAR